MLSERAPNLTQPEPNDYGTFAKSRLDCLLEGMVQPTGHEPVTPALRRQGTTAENTNKDMRLAVCF